MLAEREDHEPCEDGADEQAKRSRQRRRDSLDANLRQNRRESCCPGRYERIKEPSHGSNIPGLALCCFIGTPARRSGTAERGTRHSRQRSSRKRTEPARTWIPSATRRLDGRRLPASGRGGFQVPCLDDQASSPCFTR